MRERNSVCGRGVWRTGVIGLVVGGLLLSGCTAESTRIAIESQQRAGQVEQAVFDRQHEGLRVLLYRELVRRLAGVMLGPDGDRDPDLAQAILQVVNDAWNERDLIEFWAVQHERAKALRLTGVDAKLYGSQAVIDLLIKSLEAKGDRAGEAAAAAAGEALGGSGSRSTDRSGD